MAQGRTVSKLGKIGLHLQPLRGPKYPQITKKAMYSAIASSSTVELLTCTWGVLYCSRIRSDNLFCFFEFIGEIGTLVGPITPPKLHAQYTGG